MLYTGIDLVEISRVAQSVSKWGDKFLAHVYTRGEIDYCKGRAAELAARLAAKEAAGKALGTGIIGLGGGAGVRWQDIEVVSDALGKPSLRLHGGASARAATLQWKDLSLSLTHTRAHALAMVVAIGDSEAVL